MPRDRREFLRQGLGAGAAGTALLAARPLAAQAAASASQVAGANDRIRVALIGSGGQGRADLMQMLRTKKAECVAIADVDDAQSEVAQKAIADDGFRKPELVTRDFRRVLDRKDIDAVIVGTPDHWHALPTILAVPGRQGRLRREAARRSRSAKGGRW